VLRNERRAAAIAKGVMPAGVPTVTMNTSGDWSKLSAQQQRQRAGAMAAYAGMGTAMDREIGRLIAHLKAIGAYDNTIFVFLSDNGAEATDPMNMGAFTRWNANQEYDQSIVQQGRPGSLTAQGAGFASASVSPLRGYKFTASEGGLRVPMIMAWPGNPAIKGGSVAAGFAHVTDMPLTLLMLAGVAPQQGNFSGRRVEPMIGADLTPMLTGAASSVHSTDKPLGYELSGNAVLFKGDYKLVKNLPPYGDGRWRLYNITADPGEADNLARSEPARFAAMQKDYAAFAKANKVLPMPEGYTAPDQIFENALRTLLIPKLLAMWPVGAALVMATAALIWWRRRRRRLPKGLATP
jgi:arylsulfatase/uncharacterized sulfatase